MLSINPWLIIFVWACFSRARRFWYLASATPAVMELCSWWMMMSKAFSWVAIKCVLEAIFSLFLWKPRHSVVVHWEVERSHQRMTCLQTTLSSHLEAAMRTKIKNKYIKQIYYQRGYILIASLVSRITQNNSKLFNGRQKCAHCKSWRMVKIQKPRGLCCNKSN